MWRIICILLLGIVSNIQAQERAIIDKVIGKVGDKHIMLSEIEEQFLAIKERQGGAPDEFRCSIMENILVQKLLLNQAELDSVIVADVEVEAQLDARIDNILAYMNNDVQQFIDYYGQTVAEVREQFREDLRDQITVERMRSQVMADITVTPSEVKAFFDQIPTDSLPYFNSEVEIGEIVMKPEINEVEREKAKKRLIDLKNNIIAGESFEELASINSDDPGSARLGGDLGWQRRGTFVPEFEAAAYSLEEGEMSEIVETEFGFHLIRLEGRRGNTIKARHILIKPEITEQDMAKARNKLDSVRLLVLNDSLTFSQAVKRFGDEDQQSFNNDGNIVNATSGSTFFEIGDLDPSIYFAIDTMKVNGITEALPFRQRTGEVYYRIVKLKTRSDPHKASLQKDYSKIRQAALESKKNEYITNWVLDRIYSAYVHIDPRYRSCPNLQVWLEESLK